MMYIQLEKYQIDESLTVKEAQDVLRQYRQYKQACALRDLNKVDSNIQKKLEYIQIVEEAVKHLDNKDEQDLVKKVYMGSNQMKWLSACDELYLNKTDYYKLRKKTLLSLAITLNIEVYIS